MLKQTRWPLFAILCFSIISCGPQPPDVPACESLQETLTIDTVTQHTMFSPSPTCMEKLGESHCGHCVYIVSGKEVFVGDKLANRLGGKAWSQLMRESVYLPAKESYAPLAAYVDNSCKKLNCNAALTRFKVKLDSLSQIFTK